MFRTGLRLQLQDSSVNLENDKACMGWRSHYGFYALVDYVIAPSHLERSFGYVQDDKRWSRVCA
jgi:hypothetical protein